MRSRRSIRKRGGEKGEGRDGMHDLPSACWARLAAARPDRREGILANVCASVTARCQVGYGASGSCAQAGCWAKSGLWRTMQRGRLDAATRLIEPGTCMLGGSVCHALLQDIVPPCASPQRAKLRPRHAVDTVPFAFAFDAPAIWNKKKIRPTATLDTNPPLNLLMGCDVRVSHCSMSQCSVLLCATRSEISRYHWCVP